MNEAMRELSLTETVGFIIANGMQLCVQFEHAHVINNNFLCVPAVVELFLHVV